MMMLVMQGHKIDATAKAGTCLFTSNNQSTIEWLNEDAGDAGHSEGVHRLMQGGP